MAGANNRDEVQEHLEASLKQTNEHILTQDFTDENDDKYWVKFGTQPFDHGVSRFAFKGTWRGSGPKKDKKCVVKVFKDEYAKNIDSLIPDLYTSIHARELASEFNEKLLPTLRLAEAPVTVEVILPKMARVDESTMTKSDTHRRKNLQISHQEYVAIEDYIEGKYVKFNSNGGYENQELSELMPAFTHWTWEKNNRKMMVCDLQGVKKVENGVTRYILTDPAVHSVEETFGLTDCGVAGMYKVLSGHKCNDICKQLGLDTTVGAMIQLLLLVEIMKQTSTTYNFELTAAEKKMNEMEKRK